MAEQLSMDFAELNKNKETNQEPPVLDLPESEEYEALDYQLVELFQKLNVFEGDKYADDKDQKNEQNQTIKTYTLEISKHTREGKIAIAVSEDHQTLLLQSNIAGLADDYKPLIIDDGYLYLRRYWRYQQRLAEQIQKRMAQSNQAPINDDLIARLDEYFSASLSAHSQDTDWQRLAVERALAKQFLIVSGGPGTGKTTTITRLLAILIEQQISNQSRELKTGKKVGGVSAPLNNGVNFNILLAAPTGKAAIRMLDSIREVQNQLGLTDEINAHMPSEAFTIHKLLGYQKNKVGFKHTTDNPLVADVVLVDEASMIDIALMTKLVEAVPANAKLILIGDKDQLASVETGSVFADICDALIENEHLVMLKKNWRFSADSDIGKCAISANQGDSQTLLNTLHDENRPACELIAPNAMRDAELIKAWDDYFQVLNHEQQNAAATVAEIFAAFNQYRVLCALRRGLNGSENMNLRIETALQKLGHIPRRVSAQGSHWYHGKPIMVTQNNYNRGLYNGDTGITLIRDGETKIYFPSSDEKDDFKAFSPIRLPAYETTWAMTIHKSQGSEFNQVALILPQEEMPLLTRQLVYTGITRAKGKVSIIASDDVLVAGVKAEALKATQISRYLETNQN